MTTNPHYFIAIPLPPEVKDHINDWKKKTMDKLSFKKWVHPQDFHITLFFLGASNNDELKKLSEKMKRISLSKQSFFMQLTQSGWFGKPAQPRIFWMGAEGSSALYHLQTSISNRCEEIGFSADKRPYKPHITVARKWVGKESFQKSIPLSPIDTVFWTVEKFVIYRTHLDREPKYETVETFPLKADK
ncbi:RNA 2',3'-cyclic phosphodiesterase [Alteribacillus sp. JSM 102045]|uniref:RNA 2',3'-cyclic phosphodiesterase n=1 Tax=Alteribacillus sp. JSM 102045 TaxID=1562101 RepID=UPI0035BFD06D